MLDSGSTHSFIDPHTVQQAAIATIPIGKLTVIVVDKNALISIVVCPKLKWTMQGQEYKAEVRVLPLRSCDIVLGAVWMKKFSPISFDFKKLTIFFLQEGK